MPRYYFDVRDHLDVYTDPEGDEVPDAGLREYALLNAREALRTNSFSVLE
jgi:hypothetical protein